MKTKFIKEKICIITEVDGKLYCIKANDYNGIVNIYNGDRKNIPNDNARVYFASYNGIPLNPYMYTDFISCMQYIRKLI